MLSSGSLRTALTAHATTVLVAVAAFLEFGVSIFHIGTAPADRVLGVYIPLWVQELTAFTGAITGFLIAVAAVGLWARYRAAWYLTLLLLPLTAFHALLQASRVSLLLFAIIVPAAAGVLLHRHRYEQSLNVTLTQYAAITTLLAVQVYGTVGSYALRDQFNTELSLVESVYYTVVTVSTVGYGDIYPVTNTARLFALSLIILGVGSFAAVVGTVIGPMISDRLANGLQRARNRNRVSDRDTDAAE